MGNGEERSGLERSKWEGSNLGQELPVNNTLAGEGGLYGIQVPRLRG